MKRHSTLLSLIAILLCSFNALAQIGGNQHVLDYATTTPQASLYTVDLGRSLAKAKWTLSGGIQDLVFMPIAGTFTYRIGVKWDTPVGSTGSGTVWFDYEDGSGSHTFNLAITIHKGAAAPSTSFTSTAACGSTTVTRNSGPPDAFTNWYWQTASGGTRTDLGTGASINITSSQSLWLRSRSTISPNPWGSELSAGSFSVTSSAPAAPSVPNHAHNWPGIAMTISTNAVAGAASYRWYTTSSGGTAISGQTGTSYTVTPANTTTYYVSALNGPCESGRLAVTATVDALPTGGPTTNANPALIYTSAMANTYYYYFDMSGVTVDHPRWDISNGTLVANGFQNNIYYAFVRWTTAGSGTVSFQNDLSPRSFPVTIYDVNAALSVPTTQVQLCGSTNVNRTANPGSYEYWFWQTTSDTQTDLGNSSTVNITTNATTLYLRRQWNIWPFPWGARQTIGSIPVITAPPVVPGVPHHAHNWPSIAMTVSVDAVSGATDYKWYTTSSGGTPIAGQSGTSYTVAPANTTTYYVSALNGPCESGRLAVTATVDPLPTGGPATNASSALIYSASLSNTYYYFFDMTGVTVDHPHWDVSNGTIVASGFQNKIYYAFVNWTTAGSGSVSFQNDLSPRLLSVNVYDVNTALSVPTTQVQLCGSTNVNRTTNPGSYEYWFWQTTSDTQTNLGNGATVTMSTNGTTLYLRRQWNIWPFPWGARQTIGSIPVISTPPPTPNVPHHAHNWPSIAITISTDAVAGATSYKWYTASTGGTPIAGQTGSSYTVTPSATTTYYVSAMNGPCESGRLAVTATVDPLPTGGSVTNQSKALKYDPSLQNVYYYQFDMTGFVVDHPHWDISNGTIVASGLQGNIYYAFVQWTTAGSATLWFNNDINPRTFPVTVYDINAPLNVSIYPGQIKCGSTIINRVEDPLDHEIWYWQKTSDTQNDLGSAGVLTLTSSGTLYIRRQWNIWPYPWGTRKFFGNINVDQPLGAPTVPGSSGGSTLCGDVPTTLTTTHASAQGYTWQIDGFAPIKTTLGSITVFPRKFNTPIIVKAYNACGESPGSSTTINVPSASAAAGVTKSVNSGTNIYRACGTSYGNTTIENPLGTVLRWEYATLNAEGPWTNWGQAGQITTSAALPAQPKIWVRAMMTTPCGNVGTTSTLYVSEKNKNYVRTYLPQNSYYAEDPVIAAAQAPGDIISSTTFFDGLGRESQNVLRFGSPRENDFITFQEFDEHGRPTAKYLPYTDLPASECDTYKSDYRSKQLAFYSEDSPYEDVPVSTKPFAKARYEPSPLNRILKQGAPGETWQPNSDDYSTNDATVKFTMELNAAGEILIWKYVYGTGLITAKDISGTLQYYSAGSLTVSKMLSEDNKVSYQYIDKEGRVVLTRKQVVNATPVNDTNYAGTYYVYDDFGAVRTTISPEATSRLSAEYHSANATNQETFLTNWAFRYRYDERGRMIMKKSPGADWIYIIYDNLDRPVMTQDGNQRLNRQWRYMKYDEANRPVIAGIYTHPTVIDQAAMTSQISTTLFNEKYNGSTTTFGYSNTVFPISSTSILTVLYYDNYDYKTLQGTLNTSRFAFNPSHLSGQLSEYSRDVKGQVTGAYSMVLDQAIIGGSTQTGLWTTRYFDSQYRPAQVISENYKGGMDTYTAKYDFAGRPTKMFVTHVDGIVWRDLSSAAVYGNKVMRTSTGGGWSSGAASKDYLPASTDGWFEFRPGQNSTTAMIGFGLSNPDVNWTSFRHAFFFSGTNILNYTENGSITSLLNTTYNANDLFRMERTGSNLTLYQNGTPILTRPIPASAFLIDMSLGTTSAPFVGFRTSFGSKTSLLREIDYDKMGRVKNVWNTASTPAGTSTRTLTTGNKYSETGAMQSSGLHSENGTDFDQITDFRYNIRGWLLRINNSDLANNVDTGPRDYFGEELSYDKSIGIGPVDLNVNGNISAVKWSKNLGLQGDGQAAYAFKYDKLNRLTDADYVEKAGTWNASTSYSEKITAYDLNGNIMAVNRKGKNGAAMDNLVYNYGTSTARSNQLLSVADGDDDAAGFIETTNSANNDFAYDKNGNMVLDQNKGTKEFVVNPSFDNGSAGWTISGSTTRLNITGGAANITASAGAANLVLKQVGIIDGNKTQVVILDIQRTSSSGNINVNVAGVAQNYSATGVYTWSLVAGNNPKDLVINVTDVWAGKINLVSIAGASVIAYNEINKPKSVTVTGYGTIATVYDATGKKLMQEAYNAQNVVLKRTDYENEFLFENGSLSNITHESGRILPGTAGPTDWEYQYNLRDHLGNTRVTFTTKENEDEAKATMENANATSETSDFLYYDEAVRINSQFFDHTKIGGTNYATRLTGSANEKYGLAKSLSVMPGDVVNVEVFAKYLDPQSSNWTTAMATLMSAIANGTAPAGTIVDGGLAGSTGGATVPYTSLLNKGNESGTAPKAYLNWLLFDRNYVFIDGGYERVDESAKESGNNGPHQTLSRSIDVQQAGYVYIYLSNENATPVEVYFDDFTVEQVMSPIVQINDYYPFGLSAGSWVRENSVPNSFLFNSGTELNEETTWYETYFRSYDPSTGRFMQVDPLVDQFSAFSPYSFAYNNPLIWIDPSGARSRESLGNNPGFPEEVWAQIVNQWLATPDDETSVSTNMGGGGWVTGSVVSEEYSDGSLYLTVGAWYNPGGEPVYIDGVAGSFALVIVEMTALDGFMNPAESSEITASNLMNGSGLIMEGVQLGNRMEAGFAPRYMSRMTQLRGIVSRGPQLKSLARKIGYVGIAVTVAEGIADGKFTAGDAAKVAIAAVQVAFPVFGLGYALLDITTQFVTGTSITDRIATAIDHGIDGGALY